MAAERRRAAARSIELMTSSGRGWGARRDAKRDRVAEDPLPSITEVIRCLRIVDGLNTTARGGEIGTSLPVFGLRPMRSPFLAPQTNRMTTA